MRVRKVTPVIGAEIHGIDLRQPLGNEAFQVVHDALMENTVVFFRDQAMSHAQQMAFGRMFGTLHVHPAAPSVDGHKEVMKIHADANSTYVNGEGWHSDVSCEAEPPMGSILQMHVLPDVGGDTLFANMVAAYEALSAPMQTMLAGLTATHDGEGLYRGRYGTDDRGRVYPKAVHPVVRTHPVTGKQALFVNSFFTTRINELSKPESDAAAGLPVPACGNAGVRLPLPVGERVGGVLGQPLGSAQGVVGLLPPHAQRDAGDGPGGRAVLPGVKAQAIIAPP